MNPGLQGDATLLVAFGLLMGSGTWSFADDGELTHQLSLADLANYRAALTGKATAVGSRSSDPPTQVSFKDLWNRPDVLGGRRVMIDGRVQRIFRQGAIGSFPALAEIWIASPAGDPFCLVVPQESGMGNSPVNDHDREGPASPERLPKPGQMVRFSGTFLKLIRYAAGDGTRLAPLVVGDQPPIPVRHAAKGNRAGTPGVDQLEGRWARSPTIWLLGLTLAFMVAGVLTWQRLRAPVRRRSATSRGRRAGSTGPDPLLEFIQPSVES